MEDYFFVSIWIGWFRDIALALDELDFPALFPPLGTLKEEFLLFLSEDFYN